jgi:hypothetical protein
LAAAILISQIDVTSPLSTEIQIMMFIGRLTAILAALVMTSLTFSQIGLS